QPRVQRLRRQSGKKIETRRSPSAVRAAPQRADQTQGRADRADTAPANSPAFVLPGPARRSRPTNNHLSWQRPSQFLIPLLFKPAQSTQIVSLLIFRLIPRPTHPLTLFFALSPRAFRAASACRGEGSRAPIHASAPCAERSPGPSF